MRMMLVAAALAALLPAAVSAQGANGKPIVPCRPGADKVYTPGAARPQKLNEMPPPRQILGVIRAFDNKCPTPVAARGIITDGR